MWLHTPEMSAFARWGQEEQTFKGILSLVKFRAALGYLGPVPKLKIRLSR